MKKLFKTVAVAALLIFEGTAIAQTASSNAYNLLTISTRSGNAEIFIVDPFNGDAKNVSNSPTAYERYPCWSNDGKKITFNSDKDGTQNLYIMDSDGKNIKQLTFEKAPAVTGMQSWPKDGSFIYFGIFGKGPAQMCRIKPDGTDFKFITTGVDPNISPDGSTVVYADDIPGGGGHVVYTMKADGTNKKQITNVKNDLYGVHPVWSPDGKTIAFGQKVGEGIEIFTCKPDGSDLKQITKLGKVSTSPAFSQDMKYISFRVCEEPFWTNSEKMKKTYSEKDPSLRPVWIIGADGTDPHLLEPLKYNVMVDGSRLPWKP